MAPSEALTSVTLGPADVPDGLALSDAAGWNQTADDWRLFATQGRVFGLRDGDAGPLVATAAALPYDGGIGWVSMVLVNPAWRHQGLATALMARCVAHLRSLGATPVLDATPAGQQAYLRIGFEDGFALARWEGTVAATGARAAAPPADAAVVSALDAQANGCGRGFLLADFLQRSGTRVGLSPARTGFVIAREGRRATQIGPLVADDESAALSLLQAALAGVGGRVFLDVPERWAALRAWLEQAGFVRQRSFVRMSLGAAPIASVNDRLFVLAGPEFG
ncbi:MAG: GNAT family N-acetyltransferase [Hydrogenophaga sp.]|uniref:GNAT family N-acetyltransferase n=1 Tax=Hydrogenophaga sp. TaxID=1904254 RepID=UPI0025BFABC7|nr:GNAT family N-acetyltransferase [Hydrogenophaga sp.]MBU7575679.1 GNAT family N-acetyltransferase [Hydrogenophaga sp.]